MDDDRRHLLGRREILSAYIAVLERTVEPSSVHLADEWYDISYDFGGQYGNHDE